MTVQFNTGNSVNGTEKMSERLSEVIKEKLDRFSEQITRVEAHLSDTNGKKEGQDDKQCMLEARLEGLQPIAVTHNAGTYDDAVTGAISKLKSSLDTTIGKLRSH
jgi:ribosome-associated translation inhibitor RaiA